MPPEWDAAYVDELVADYFSDPQYQIQLKKGEILFRQGETNDRLYLLLGGALHATAQMPEGSEYEVFHTASRRFVGVFSFFSETYRSLMAIVADADSELAFIDAERFARLNVEGGGLFEKFMPVVVAELVHRHQHTQELMLERERAFQKLLQNEKMATLGQMASGIAHELNNAIAVLDRNSAWLSDTLSDAFLPDDLGAFYRRGLTSGQGLSSRELRQRSRGFQKKFRLDDRQARQAAESGMTDRDLGACAPCENAIAQRHNAWKVGASLHDVQLAAQQSAHVVRSVRTLGAPRAQESPELDVNETIQDALSLLQSPLRQVRVVLELGVLPAIAANKSELVQIWTNLIKNACESMAQADSGHRELRIVSDVWQRRIRVRIRDSGPGIPQDILPRIFQPNVTTKIDGLSFGLGLGLTIVLRLAQRYGGTVNVESRPGKTEFCVTFPTGAST